MKNECKKLIKEALEKLNLEFNESIIILSSDKPEFGDYSTSIALTAGKKLNRQSSSLAYDIVKNMNNSLYFYKIEVMGGGFINFFISYQYLVNKAKKNILKSELGSEYSKKNIIVEFSSPNIAKPFNIGHLRSTIIGDAVANLLSTTGARVFKDNHLGDWGTQFGKQIYAIKEWGNEEEIEKSADPVYELVKLYVKFHTESEKNLELNDLGREWFKKLENNDKEAVRIWKKCILWSLKEFKKIYNKLNINFSENNGEGFGESYFQKFIPKVIKELNSKNILKESEGSRLVFFSNPKLPPLMILKKDGASLYSTRDLAADYYRLTNKRYGKNLIIINEAGSEQSLYFKQLYETETLLNWYKKDQRIHIGHGLYRFKDSKMSTRKGNTVLLKDVLLEAENKVKKLTNKVDNNKNITAIAVAALKWNDLKKSPILDVVFNWDEILSMQGNSGPYLLYTYARCHSVIEKAKKSYLLNFLSSKPSSFDILKNLKTEYEILRLLQKYESVVSESANKLTVSDICTYLFNLAKLFNSLYQEKSILNEENSDLKYLRVLITNKTAVVIKHGLSILGISVLNKM